MLRPLHDRVWIKPYPNPETTASGLLLAEHPKPETIGTIIALGASVSPSSVHVGDTVIFSWTCGQEIILDNQRRYLMMREDDLMAVLET